MKREWIAGALLALLIGLAALNIHYLDRLTAEMHISLEHAEHAAARGDFEAALTAMENALALWQSESGYTSVFLRHNDVDSASDAFYELEELLRQADGEGAPAAFAKLRYHLQIMDTMEHLSLGTVF